MVACVCENTENHLIVYFKRVSCVACELYLTVIKNNNKISGNS